MLYRETVAVYCENDTENTYILCGQNAEFWRVKTGGTYSNHWALKGSRVLCCLVSPLNTLFYIPVIVYLLQPLSVCDPVYFLFIYEGFLNSFLYSSFMICIPEDSHNNSLRAC
jgi:hypothetical protein